MKAEGRGRGPGVVYLTALTLLLPLFRCQITSAFVLGELRASPRSYKSDSVTGYARLYMPLWETATLKQQADAQILTDA